MEKTMYEKVDWPDIQEFMEDYDYTDRVYFDPEKNAWFVPEDMIKKYEIKEEDIFYEESPETFENIEWITYED